MYVVKGNHDYEFKKELREYDMPKNPGYKEVDRKSLT